ncbi:MAG: dihydrolipoamide acetyltransferase family protein [Actinomycetota bacterium]
MPDGATEVLPWRERSDRPAAGPDFLSPAVSQLLAEHDLDPTKIEGTGTGGRVTREDVLRALQQPVTPGPEPRVTGDERVPFNSVRKRTAEHMVQSLATAPHATIVMDVDFEAVARARRAHPGRTYLPFIARAVVDAIEEFPRVNATGGEDELVVHRDVHLGIAIDLGQEGLIVPVVRYAHEKRLLAIADEIRELATRARGRRLAPDDVVGATFTITNPGPYGTELSVPVINQPQVAILATDRVALRPVVVESPKGDSIAVRPVGHLSLSFDHRAFDGAYAASFLGRVREILENRPWEVEL